MMQAEYVGKEGWRKGEGKKGMRDRKGGEREERKGEKGGGRKDLD
jgi:hypothetical protein